jgi:SAM-dependent methyltransferase
MGIDRSRRITFEEVADLYSESCPCYPEPLVDDVISHSKIPEGGRILEIGCGPGNATILFARRSFEILAIELGHNLSAIARENCQSYPKVSILKLAFEDWPVEVGGFDLAISADAFHWVQPEVGYPMVASALKPAGKLAFFWNSPYEIVPEISDALAQVYKARAPQAEKPEGSFTAEWMIKTINEVIAQSGCFNNIMVKSYPVTEILSADHYIKNLWTYSTHRPLAREIREYLYDGIRMVLDRYGGRITTNRKVILFIAGKK